MMERNLYQSGFFGKVPMRGDFVNFNLDQAFRGSWETWLNGSLSASKRELGDQWLELFLNAPLWRFIMGPNCCGADPVAGVFLPNVDKIGRYYPLVLGTTLPGCAAPARLFKTGDGWFQRLEAAGLLSLEEECSYEAFEAAARQVEVPAYDRIDIPPNPTSRHIAPGAGIHDAYTAVLDQLASGDQGGFSLWWSSGSDRISPTLLCAPQMPGPEQFSAFLDGDWKRRNWQVATPIAPELSTPFQREGAPAKPGLTGHGYGDTHPGTIRQKNQDSWLALDKLQLYCVADGVGGHDEGDFASGLVTQRLSGIATTTYKRLLRGIAEALHDAHETCLHRARQLGSNRIIATTATVLVMDDTHYTLIWAGDSRAYHITGGRMLALTCDHVDAANGHLTKAIGVGNILDPDIHLGRVRKGDRFILLSDGITNALAETEIEAIADSKTGAHATRALMEAALIAGARDNITALVVDVSEIAKTDQPLLSVG
jgi:type VI secretion system protein ImpM